MTPVKRGLAAAATVGCAGAAAYAFHVASNLHANPYQAADAGIGIAVLGIAWWVVAFAACGVTAVFAILALRRPEDATHRVSDAEAGVQLARRAGAVRLLAIGLLVPTVTTVLATLLTVGGLPFDNAAGLGRAAASALLPVTWLVGGVLVLVGGVQLARSRGDPWAADPEVDLAQRELEAAAANPPAEDAQLPSLLLDAPTGLPWERR